jgi:para-nitrobenzyl esterase
MSICIVRRPFFVAAVVASICGTAAAAAPLEVKTAQGRIVGEQSGDVRVYRGIPYAAPPVGDLRWRDPQPAASWSGVRDATKFSARCMQSTNPAQGRNRGPMQDLPVSEDCLYLNVWTAAERAQERRPVIVWIHGGTFIVGTGAAFDGTTFAQRGVVLVTINYRLNAFGMFAHPALTAESARHVSGNYSFADTLAALAWVRENIGAFGGDPRQVTVAGNSAGGRLIQSLRTSPCARGLLRRAIVESAPIRILALRRMADAERDGVAAAEKMAAPTLAQLRALPAQQVLENLEVGQPVIDGQCITADPLRALAAGRTHDVDLLVGSNADEGTFPYLRAREYGVGFTSAADFSAYARERFGDDLPAFQQTYRAQDETAFDAAQREAFRDEMAWLARFSAGSHARHGRTFLYFFSHRPPPPATGPDRGATHGSEIPFAQGTEAANWRDEDRRVAKVMAAYWSNFAARGDPNGPGLPTWPAFTPENPQRMNLGPMTPEPALDPARIAIYDTLYRRVIGTQLKTAISR